MILLITNKNDITTDFIVNKLNMLGENYYRFNTEELAVSININFDLNQKKYLLYDSAKDIEIDLKDVKSIYYRRPELPNLDNLVLGNGEKYFWHNEITYTLEGIYKILKDRFWISPIFAIREAENKIHQIIMAQELCLKVPPSIITNIPQKAKQFIHNYDKKCIIKPIKVGLLKDENNPQIIFTNQLEEKHIESLHKISNCPTYFQKLIRKQADIRVTVVGNKVFSARIDSQEYEETKMDWRKGENIKLKHSSIKLPLDIECKCLELTKKLNLNFGAIDFILDENGEFIFLEINPNGQWGWIEKRLNLGICNSIIELLVNAGV